VVFESGLSTAFDRPNCAHRGGGGMTGLKFHPAAPSIEVSSYISKPSKCVNCIAVWPYPPTFFDDGTAEL
jgi:hypothetical protein